jgi:hypothetical protein
VNARALPKMTDTQRMRNRALQEAAERQGRMLGRLFALEIIGFAFIITMELLK